MTAVWLVVGVVIGLAVGAALVAAATRRSARRRVEAAEHRARDAVAAADERAAAADRRLADAARRAVDERGRAEDAGRRAADALAAASIAEGRALAAETELAGASVGMLDAAWALAGLRVGWDLRRHAALVPAAASTPEVDLVVAAGAEVQRIREEIGTPGVLAAQPLPQLPAPVALVALLAVEGLLAAVVRRTQAYDLSLACADGYLLAEVACEGDEGITADDADLASVTAAVARAGADLRSGRRSDGVLVARLRVPLP